MSIDGVIARKKVGFIGTGNMGEALIDGLIESKKLTSEQIFATDSSKERTDYITETYGIKFYDSDLSLVDASDIIIMAVKPHDMAEALKEIAPSCQGKLIVSIAAGITTDFIKETLEAAGVKNPPIIRVMPNTPALIGEGAIGILAGKGTHSENLYITEEIFLSVGKVSIIDDESLMDSVTGLSGSGPAYVFLFIKSLIEAGMDEGLDEETSKTLAVQTVIGAAKLAEMSDSSLDELITMVSSPNGTTVEGLKTLNDGNFSKTIKNAVASATNRSKELSGG